MSEQQEITLSQLLQQSIAGADECLEAPDQVKLATLLSNFKLCSALIERLALFSPNETLEDLTTSSLRCFFVEYYLGTLTVQLKSSGTVQRLAHLREARVGSPSEDSPPPSHLVARRTIWKPSSNVWNLMI